MMRKLFLSLCMVCTTIAVCILIACEKPIIQDDSVVSGSPADANLIVTVYEIEKTPFEYFTRGTSGSAARAAKPASEACTRLNFAIYDEGGYRLPATYANFLVINGAVLCPTYDQPDLDAEALRLIGEAFPDREIVGIDCRSVIKQHGSLHCCTMQYPSI